MPTIARQIFAFSGLINRRPGERASFALIEHAISLAAAHRAVRAADPSAADFGAAAGRTRVCYVPTATGDLPAAVDGQTEEFAGRADVEFSVLRLFMQPSVPDVRAHLLAQDVVLVEGGSVVNLMAVWRAHGLPQILRDCWEAGVVLAGTSAGSLCWHVGGPTDSFGDNLDPFSDGLAFLPYSNGVHDDLDDQPRRQVYRELVASGGLPAGYATEDGVGLHYVGTELHEAVTMRPGARAWFVQPATDGGYAEQPVLPRPI